MPTPGSGLHPGAGLQPGSTSQLLDDLGVSFEPLPAWSPKLRWWVCDSLTGNIVGRLNPNQFEITEEIRASTVGTVRLPVPSTPNALTGLRNLIMPGDRRPHGRAIAMEDTATGRVLFYGPIVQKPVRDGAAITVTVNDWSAWFRSCVVRPTGSKFATKRDYTAVGVEQCTIMRDLFKIALGTDTLGSSSGKPNIVVDDAPTSGVTRNLTARMFTKIGEQLDEYANLSDGAEWYTYATRDTYGTTIVAHVAVAWPERGGGTAPVRISWRQDLQGRASGNVDSFTWPGSEDSPTREWAIDGNEVVALWGYDQAPTIGVTDIFWEGTIDLVDGTTKKAQATARAKGELKRVLNFDGLLEVTLPVRADGKGLQFTSLVCGDRARVEIDDLWNRTINTPASRITRRVMSGGAGQITQQVLTIDIDDNDTPFTGSLPGVAVTSG